MCLLQVSWFILVSDGAHIQRAGHQGDQKGEPYERFDFYHSDHRLLPGRDWLLAWLRTAEVRRRFPMLENAVLILISLLLFGYLMYALLKPENF
jgi:K+-transporting ATPase KdpF subunit